MHATIIFSVEARPMVIKNHIECWDENLLLPKDFSVKEKADFLA